MKTIAIVASLFAVAIGNQSFANQSLAGLPASVTSRGGLAFGGAEIDIVAYAPGWDRLPVKSEWISVPGIGRGAFTIRGKNDATLFRGKGVWAQGDGGSVTGRIEISCVAAAEVQCLSVSALLPSEPPLAVGDDSAAAFDLPLSDNRTARIVFTNAIPYHVQDLRQWGSKWTVRFGETAVAPRSCTPGDKFVWNMAISAPGGLALSLDKPILIAEGPDWVRLDFFRDIEPGSALDFSNQGLQDAPAGKHGWLKSVGGHFEFEGVPGVEQRFYGVNLCFTANYPDHDVADRMVDRLVRSGYNALRVHHHDGAWAKDFLATKNTKEHKEVCNSNFVDSVSFVAKENITENSISAISAAPREDSPIDRLDYLLAKCFERGIYVTTDLYVSRKAPWRDIGIDRDGTLNQNLYKTYVGVHDGAFADWCKWSRAFLEHVNPYTGRAYKDEPGLPLISLINEGILAMGWESTGKATDPFINAAWREYCATGGAGGEATPPLPSPDAGKAFEAFDAWLTRRIFVRCAGFVRSLGCRALLTNDNNGRFHGEGEGCTPLYDYIDSHFYVDHPTFIDQPWSLPAKCGNDNLIKANKPAIFHRGWAKGASKPYTITEWNIAYPGYYRGMGGILTGAMAAEQEWDGLWRFAYSHDRNNILDGGHGGSQYFDCVLDPLISASDRASVCLYLRGDAQQQAANGKSALRLDKEQGSMALVTPRTCGGFAESGRIEAGPLSFEICSPCATTLWASSLDGEPLERSSRILLVHLADVQGEGAQFADAARRILLRWGEAPLVAAGAAEVELRLDGGAGAMPPSVWSLDTAGNRMEKVPAAFEGDSLRFRASTAGPQGGRIFYEIVR